MSGERSMSEADIDPVTPDSGASLAARRLREAREGAGLHIGALAAMLKVPVERLQALEDGRLEDLPDVTFARALAQSVCRALKVDAAPVLDALPRVGDVRLGGDEHRLNTPFYGKPARGGHLRLPSGRPLQRWLPVWLALVLLALAVLLWWWLPQREPGAAPAAEVGNGTPALAGVAPVTATQVAPMSGAAPQSEPVPPAGPDAPSVPPAAAVAALPASSQRAEHPLLRLSARQPSWVQVTGASGALLLQRSLEPGEAVSFDADAPMQVVVGRVDETEVWVRGQPRDLASVSRNNVARFEVK
jgi:cytoskeleton protein RodZ